MSVGLARDYDPTITLRGGYWVNVRGIMRWQGPRPVDEPEPGEAEIASGKSNVACTTCLVPPWQACKTPNGASSKDHLGRVIPRQCVCGGALDEPGKWNCASCRAASIAARKSRKNAHRRRPDVAA